MCCQEVQNFTCDSGESYLECEYVKVGKEVRGTGGMEMQAVKCQVSVVEEHLEQPPPSPTRFRCSTLKKDFIDDTCILGNYPKYH